VSRLLFLLSFLIGNVAGAQYLQPSGLTPLPETGTYNRIEIADMNNDGNKDVVLSAEMNGSTRIEIYENTDDTYVLRYSVTFPFVIAPPQILDYDGDNDLELLSSDQANETFALINNGNFIFQEESILDIGAVRILVEDLSRDGEPELILSRNAGRVSIFTRGPQTWELVFEKANISLTDIQIFDQNHDGKKDVILSGIADGDGKVILLKAIALWQFTETTLLEYQARIALSDIDSDGFQDLVASSTDGQPTVILFNQGNGFRADTAPTQIHDAKMFAADFDVDGIADIAFFSKPENGIPSNVIISPETGNQDLPADDVVDVAYADLDHDGDLDVIQLLSGGTSALRVFDNTSVTINSPPTPASGIRSVIFDGNILLTWERSSDDHTAASAITYDVAMQSQGEMPVAPDFDLISGERLITHHGNAGTSNFFLLKNNASAFQYSIQAIDNGMHSNERAIVTGVISCTSFAREEILVSNEPVDLEAPQGAVWFSVTNGLLQEGSTFEFTPHLPDTIISLGPASNDCGDVKVYVIRYEERTAFLPALFSPNADGKNDLLNAYGLHEVAAFEFRIYNREGTVVYSSTNANEITVNGWNGTSNGRDQPVGVYYWEVKGETAAGTKILFNGKSVGSVVLMR